jgi:hypothetical protein
MDQEHDARKQANALKLRALARETQEQRAALTALSSSDVVRMLDALDQLGADAGVDLKIGQAQVVPAADPLRGVAFIVNAEGSFSAVLKAASLATSLPMPSRVDQLQFERLPGTSGWRLGARVRFITSENVSI